MAKFQFGTAGYIGFIHSAGTLDLSANFVEISWEISTETVDISSGNDTYNKTMTGMSSFSASCTFYLDDGTGANGTATAKVLTPPVEGTFLFGPFGTATNKPKYGGAVTVTSHNMENLGYGKQDAVQISFDMEGNGAPIWNHGSVW